MKKVLGMFFLVISAPLWAAGEGSSPTPRTTKEGHSLVCREGTTMEVPDYDVKDGEIPGQKCPKREVCLDTNPNVVNFYDVTVVRPFNEFEGPNYVTGGTGSTCLFEVCMTEGDPNRPENLQNYPAERTSHNPVLCANHPEPTPEPEPEPIPEPVDPGPIPTPTPIPNPEPEPKLVSESKPECAFIEPDRATGLVGEEVLFELICREGVKKVPCDRSVTAKLLSPGTTAPGAKVICQGNKCRASGSGVGAVVAEVSAGNLKLLNSTITIDVVEVPSAHREILVPYASSIQGTVGQNLTFHVNFPDRVQTYGGKVLLYNLACTSCKDKELVVKAGEIQLDNINQGMGVRLFELLIDENTQLGKYQLSVWLVDAGIRTNVLISGTSEVWIKSNPKEPIRVIGGEISTVLLNKEQTDMTAEGWSWDVALTYGKKFYLPTIVAQAAVASGTELSIGGQQWWLPSGYYNILLIGTKGGQKVTFWYPNALYSPGVMLQ